MLREKVYGFACPWNEYNSYKELMRPGAFKRFIDNLGDEPLPMRVCHEPYHVGWWTRLREGSEGLFCEGMIQEPNAAQAFKEGLLPELSIAWRFPDHKVDNLEMKTTRIRYNSAGERYRYVFDSHGLPVVESQKIDEAILGEISLVDDGAFKGTWVRHG